MVVIVEKLPHNTCTENITKEYNKGDISTIFRISNKVGIRNDEFKLEKKIGLRKRWKGIGSQRMVGDWSRLSYRVVSDTSIVSFKRSLYIHMEADNKQKCSCREYHV